MTFQRDPPRLKSGAEAPPELLRALRALRDQDTGSARLTRVEGRLGELLDAAPPPATPAASNPWWQLVGRKLLSARVIVAALAIGATAIWFGRSAPQPARHEPAMTTPAARAPSPQVVVAPALVEPLAQPSPVAEVSAPEAVTQTKWVRRSKHVHRAARESTAVVAAGSTVAPAAKTELPSAEPVKLAAPEALPEPEPEARPEPPPAPKQTEVQLLFKARQEMEDDPRAALRALDEHAARFPTGMLAPEREVMAIEALRKLGQTAAADARLRDFRAHYPQSLHRRRLERSND